MRTTTTRKFYGCLFSLLLLLWLSSIPAVSQEYWKSSYTEAIRAFEKFVESRMEQDRAPAVCVGFLKNGFIWARGFGLTDLENGVRAKPDSAYRLASITKTITAVAVLQLEEQGRIDLDAEVQKYVPFFPPKKWPVTVRLLLGHLGGISHYKDYSIEGRIREPKTTREALAIFQDFDLIAKPGTTYNYSSYGFNLLGAVIEGASGLSYGDYIRKHIFEPLGMNDTHMDDPSDIIPNRVRGYRIINGKLKNSEYINISSRFAGGGTRSTVLDLLAFAQGICRERLLMPATWDRMFRSMTTSKGFFTGYGMGWRVSPLNGHFQVQHGGSQPETRTHLLIFPRENFAVAIASNLEGIDLSPYYLRLASLVLGENLAFPPYLTDTRSQMTYNACAAVFNHGLSRHMQNRGLPGEAEGPEKAFLSFNSLLSPESTKPLKNLGEELEMGFHPAGGERFIRMGAYMASVLEKTQEGGLSRYFKSGPLAFFSDFSDLAAESSSFAGDKSLLSADLSSRLLQWRRTWEELSGEMAAIPSLSISTDFKSLARSLKRRFSGKEIYPDFSGEIAAAGRSLLEGGFPDNATAAFRLNADLYGKTPSVWADLAEAYIWTNRREEAAKCYSAALALNPKSVYTGVSAFLQLIGRLSGLEKNKEALTAAELGLEIHAGNSPLLEFMGDLHLRLGEAEKARKCYEQALIKPLNKKRLKSKIQALRKRR